MRNNSKYPLKKGNLVLTLFNLIKTKALCVCMYIAKPFLYIFLTLLITVYSLQVTAKMIAFEIVSFRFDSSTRIYAHLCIYLAKNQSPLNIIGD